MKNQKTPSYSKQHSGLTLIELMIAMALGLVLMIGILYVFQGSRQSFKHGDTMARIQENGRIAIDTISRDIRLTGFTSCLKAENYRLSNVASPAFAFDITQQDFLFGRTYAGGADPIVGANGVANSHLITIRHFSEFVRPISKEMPTKDADVFFNDDPGTPNFQVNQIVAVGDCENIDVFRVSAVQNNPAGGGVPATVQISHGLSHNSSAELSTKYGATGKKSQLIQIIEFTYYIARTGRLNTAGQPVFALFRRPTSDGVRLVADESDVEEIAEGIEDMRITYGVDTSAAPPNYSGVTSYIRTNAMAANQWRQVISAQVELLVGSVESNALEARQTYVFDGAPVNAADLKMRTSVSTTNSLRNRL